MTSENTHPEEHYEQHDSLPGRDIAQHAFAGIQAELSELVDSATLESINERGAELIDTYQISPELFESPVHTLMFAAIAKRAGEIPADDTAGREFIADATMLLALQHSGRYESVKNAIDTDPDDNHELAATYEKFTDQELTTEMEHAIESGLLTDVRERLGVTADNEDSYEIRVLNLSDEYSLAPLRPSRTVDDTPEQTAAITADRAIYDAYAGTMLANLKQFTAEAGVEGRIPPAWNTQIEGKTVLCLPSPVAKVLLDPSVVKNRSFSRVEDAGERSDQARLQSLIEHEYAHTQGGVALDHQAYFGMTLEEYRVENASGNKNGYADAKIFVRQLEVMTGFDAAEYFDRNGKQASEHFFNDMASVVGIDAMLEIALVPPAQYLEDTRQMQQSVNNYLGGYNGVLTRLHEATKADPKRPERAAVFTARMRGFPAHVRQSWLGYASESYRMPFVAELYKELGDE
jgi:hypothetical protein